MNLQKNFLTKVFILISFLSTLQSCKGPDQGINETFQQKFGKAIEKVKAERTPPVVAKTKDGSNGLNFSGPAEQDWRDLDDSQTNNEFYANVDATEYDGVRVQRFFPDAGNLERARASGANLPDDVFDIVYNTTVSPPFAKSGAEFDNINIPAYDAYGVRTEMSEKEYLFAGNDSLQKNLDQINSNRTPQDIEASTTIIKEQRQLKKEQKIIKTFGASSTLLDGSKKIKSEAKKLPKNQAKQPQTNTKLLINKIHEKS